VLQIRLETRFTTEHGEPCFVQIFLTQGGKVLRQSTIDAVTRLQNAADAVPASTGGNGEPAPGGATAEDLDNLDATLNEISDQLETKAQQPAPQA
jgi:hypothetical protein